MDLETVRAIADRLRNEVHKAIIGQDDIVDLMLTALVAGGHLLLEGVPGTAKTLLTQAFAAALSLKFGRIQFTPDLMPGDLIGTNLFDFQKNSFILTKGPVFTELLLADEINRSPPKTQAALLQAMNERAVTIDGKDNPLGEDFMVIATQNPIEQQGTYPLPEAQLDRFLFKVIVAYPTEQDEQEIVRRHGHRTAMPRLADFGLMPVVDRNQLRQVRDFVSGIALDDEVIYYIVELVRSTRNHPAIEFGASTRAANMIATGARAYAALNGRSYVLPDDVKFLISYTLQHRIILTPRAETEGLTAEKVLRQLLAQVKAPR